MRYLVLTASVLIQMCLGGIFAWSTFVVPLRSDFGLKTSETQLIFGITFTAFPIITVFAGRWQDRYGPRPVAAASGILFAAGYFLASLSRGSFGLLLLGIGIMGGAAIGLGYVCPIATCIKWFPNIKGSITGLSVAGFGLGAVILSFIAGKLFSTGYNVLEIFKLVGLAYGSVIVFSAMFLSLPKHYKNGKAVTHVPVRTLFSQRKFWSLVAGLFAGTFGGLMVIGNVKPIGLSAGLSDTAAALAISTLAVGNAAGRVTWGGIVDRIGRRAITLSLLNLIAAVLLLIPAGAAAPAFALAAAAVGAGFGSCFVVYAARVASEYGTDSVGSIYPLVFIFYAVSGLTGPFTGGWLYDTTGSYHTSLIVAAAVAFCGMVVSGVLSREEADNAE